MSSRPVLGFPAKKLLAVLPLFAALACVDLTPPWEKNRGRDAGKDVPQAGHTEGAGGASGNGGTGGSGDRGGSGGIGGSGRSDVVDAADLPSADSNSDDALPERDASDAPVGPPDARVDRYSAGGATADAGRDVPADVTGGRGGTSAGGAGGSLSSSSRRGGRTSGGSTTGGTSGGSSARGGSASGGNATGGSGGDAGVADAPSRCLGYVGPTVDGGLSGGLVAYYSCDQSSGPTLIDQSGDQDATLRSGGTGGASGAYSFSTGKVGQAVSFTVANKGYASLPADLLNGACEVTIATWVYLNSNPNWQRVWDFGRDSTSYVFLTSNNGGQRLKFAISVDGMDGESSVTTDGLPLGTWKHVALVLNSSGATIFVDGQQKANNPAIVLRPADLGNSLRNYIGRSQFSADPYLDGKIDEFRVYNRALSAQEIQALFTGP